MLTPDPDNHRFSIHYGEEHARLSRDQSILDIPKVSRSIPFRMASRLLFKIPDAHLQVLDSLYVDNLVYVEHWRDAMTAIHEEWLMCSYWVSMIPQMYAAIDSDMVRLFCRDLD